MSRISGYLALIACVLAIPSNAKAQYRGARNAPAMTANGPVYNPTQTPEWRQAGGNYAVWEQIMMQKMAAQEQAAFQKEMAAYQKMLKAQGKKPQTALNNDQTGTPVAPVQRRVKKKKTSLKPSTTAKASPTVKTDKPSVDTGETEIEEAIPASTSKKATTTKSTIKSPSVAK